MRKEIFIIHGHDVADMMDGKYVIMSMSAEEGSEEYNYEFVENIVFDSIEDAVSYHSHLERDVPSEAEESFAVFRLTAEAVIIMQHGKTEVHDV